MRVLVSPSAAIPSFDIGLRRPFQALARAGALELRIRVSGQVSDEDVAWADCLVFCRNQEPHDLLRLEQALNAGKAVIYDIDDNFLRIPLVTPEGRFHRDPVRLHVLKQMASLSTLVRTYSPRLAEDLAVWRPDVQLRRCNIDAAIVDGVARRTAAPDAPVQIAYASGRVDSPDLLALLEEVVAKAGERFGGKVGFVFWKQLSKRLEGRAGIEIRRPTSSYEAFIRELYAGAFEIGLAPALDTPFFNSKTNTKYRDYGLCGVAALYSSTDLYRDTVLDGRTGLLVDNSPAAWLDGLDRLVSEPAYRAALGRAAEADVRDRFGIEGAIAEWRQDLGLEAEGALR